MAARTAIVTDSTCNLPPELAAERRIYVAPLYVLWGEQSLRDGIDIQEIEFYQRLRSTTDIPKTSQVTPQDFATLFEQARAEEEADAIVCVVLSSELSGTYASATLARGMVDFPVHVVDSRQVSWALGHAALAGADARDQGASPEERSGGDASARQHLVFTIDSLNTCGGGRIGSGKLFGQRCIKPVLTLRDGVIEPLENVRTRKRALERLSTAAEKLLDGKKVGRLSVLHADAEAEALTVLEAARAKFSPTQSHIAYATTVLGVHAGPGAVGLVVEWQS